MKVETQEAKMIIGVDEVGRGPLVGDLVVCAVAFRRESVAKEFEAAGLALMDSKAFSSKGRRGVIFDALVESKDVVWSIERKSPEEIDSLGIHLAVLNSMRDAALAVAHKIRGNEPEFRFDGRFVPKEMVGMNVEAIVKGDSKVPEISAASIIAKEIRDREMAQLGQIYPDYGFEKNAGYGTAQHIEAIGRLGLLAEHRSWARKFLKDV